MTFEIIFLTTIFMKHPVEDDISRILQLHDSFPPSVESCRYEDDALSWALLPATSELPDWPTMTR